MAKKGVEKTSKKKSVHKSANKKNEHEKMLVENFVALQKVMTHLSGKFDDLSRQISELLKLFEDSAKVVVKGEMERKNENHGEKQMLDTMMSILDQNKVIAKGLTLMYETLTDSGVHSKPTMSSGSIKSSEPVKKIPAPVEKKRTVKEDDYVGSKNLSSFSEDDPFSMNVRR